MQYIGGKFRTANWIVPILQQQMTDHRCLHFVDLFSGACNIVGNMPATGRRIANDLHADLIALWQAVQNGYAPPLPCHVESMPGSKRHGVRLPTRCGPSPDLAAATGENTSVATTRMELDRLAVRSKRNAR